MYLLSDSDGPNRFEHPIFSSMSDDEDLDHDADDVKVDDRSDDDDDDESMGDTAILIGRIPVNRKNITAQLLPKGIRVVRSEKADLAILLDGLANNTSHIRLTKKMLSARGKP